MAKLLLVDDEEDALAWMTAALEARGHEVRAYSDARSALDGISAFAPDLILADVLMPEMDGLAFARHVRKRCAIPVVFVTITRRKADAVIAGGVGFVLKPATATELRAAVDRVLGEPARKNAVLVVDDDEDARAMYRSFLEERFEVFTSENGVEALKEMHAHPVDLAIVDVHMPVMNGAELVRAMRRDPALEKVPVVIQTTDRAALEAPLWGKLDVSQVMGKESFLDWLEGNMPAPTARR
jgi:CheY-like chemotaxis protein